MQITHIHSFSPDEKACETCSGHVYEIMVNARWCKVTTWVFRSWTGPRRLDGKPYVGPSYFLGSMDVA